MLVSFSIAVISLLVMLYSANKFVDSSAGVATYYRVSPLVIGMLIIGFGTSAPELLVSSIAAIEGTPSLALGNAIGSNIANIGLILGITALIAPIAVASRVTKIEIPFLVLITLLIGFFLYDGKLTGIESVSLLVIFALFIVGTFITNKRTTTDELGEELDIEKPKAVGKSWAMLVISLLFLLASARMLVDAATDIASLLGVSELIIGLTIVAIGTSLPELASSIIAARKGQNELAIGNIVGSNLFNSLSVIGLAGVIKPMDNIPSLLIYRDWGVMLIMTILLLLMAFGITGKGRVNRIEGFALLTIYVLYLGVIIYSSQ